MLTLRPNAKNHELILLRIRIRTLELKRNMEKMKFPKKILFDRERNEKNLKERFNGNTVYFKITKDEAKQYKRD